MSKNTKLFYLIISEAAVAIRVVAKPKYKLQILSAPSKADGYINPRSKRSVKILIHEIINDANAVVKPRLKNHILFSFTNPKPI